MTAHAAAAADFHLAHSTAPWLQGVGVDDGAIIAYTKFDLPEPLKEKLSVWQGWAVVFHVSGRVCLE